MEVMLAVLVLGMSMTVFFSAASQGVDVVVRARGYQEARELFHWLDLQEPLDLEELEEGRTRGRLQHPQHGSFSWERMIEVEGNEEDELFLVTTRVEQSGDRTLQETREEFLYLPVARRRDWVKEPWDE